MSPQRTQQLFSPHEFVTASEHDALHTRQQQQQPLPVPSVETVVEELHDVNLVETSPVPASVEALVPSEEEATKTLTSEKEAAHLGSAETRIIWAERVLRLTDRHRLRQCMLTGSPSAALPLPLYELEQDALDLVRSATIPHATFIRGLLHEFGKNGERLDRQEAFRLFKQAASEGFPRADYRLGLQFEKVGEMRRACACYERGAAKDDAACLYRLGMMIIFGQHGYPLDKDKGVQCLHLSAIGADADAPLGALVYGLLLAGETKFKVDATLIQPNEAEALSFIKKAAMLGSPGAQVRLGKAYERNELGLPFDPRLSLHYHQLGALGGDPEADLALSKWYLAGTQDGAIQKDEDQAFRHTKLAAMRCLPAAEFGFGYFYEIGIGCTADLIEARTWYARAAGHGNTDAAARLDGLARQRTLSRRDHEMNVAVQITARHATIKLNSQAAEQRRQRQHIMQSPGHARHRSDFTRTHQSTPSLSPQRRAPPIPQMSDTETADLLAPRSPQHARMSPGAMPPASPTRVLGHNSPEHSAHGKAPWLHRRGESWAPQGSPFVSHDTAALSPRQAQPFQPGHGHTQSVASPYQATADRTMLRFPYEERGMTAVQSWELPGRFPDTTQRRSLGPEEMPRTAPTSDVGSCLEEVMAARGSPRPESSVSNIIPTQQRIAASLGAPPEESTTRGFALSDEGALANSPIVKQPSTSAVSSSTTSSAIKRGGAATFEEMGIPLENKKEADCIVM
jgi:TPR repeat protein